MVRPQFSLHTLLVAMLVASAFFGGASWSHRRVRHRISDLENETQFAESMLSLLKADAHNVGIAPERHFFMDEESWSLVQHAAEKARLDTSVWIKRRLAKAASKELRRRTPPMD